MNLKKGNITLKEIAKELEVSVSTVSKALRNSDEIGAETRQKIQAFADYYHYKPNSVALSLRNRTTKSIALIVPQIVNHFFTNVIQGVEKEANSRDYNVIFTVSNDSIHKEVMNMQTLSSGSIDGFMLSLGKETLRQKDFHHLIEAAEQGNPIVLFDRCTDEIHCDKVMIDDEESGRLATNYLLDTGCKNIIFITTEDFVSVANLRYQGYCKALLENNLPLNHSLIIKVKDELSADEIEKFINSQLREIEEKGIEYDGVIGVNEIYTVIAVNWLKKNNKKIPEMVSVIAFSDGVLPKYSFPSLTAVSQNGVKMGETAARLLIDKLEGKMPMHQYQTVIIETELVKRDSTK